MVGVLTPPDIPPPHTHRARGSCGTIEDGVCGARSCSGHVPPRQARRPAPPCSGRGRRQHLPEVVWGFERTWGQDEQLTFTAASRITPGRTTTTLLSAKHLRECRPHRERAVCTGRELSTQGECCLHRVLSTERESCPRRERAVYTERAPSAQSCLHGESHRPAASEGCQWLHLCWDNPVLFSVSLSSCL